MEKQRKELVEEEQILDVPDLHGDFVQRSLGTPDCRCGKHPPLVLYFS